MFQDRGVQKERANRPKVPLSRTPCSPRPNLDPFGSGPRGSQTEGSVKVPRRRNAEGFTDPLRQCGPSLRPPQGPDVRLQKMVTLHREDTAASAVIGPLTKTRRSTTPGSRLRRSVCMEP